MRRRSRRCIRYIKFMGRPCGWPQSNGVVEVFCFCFWFSIFMSYRHCISFVFGPRTTRSPVERLILKILIIRLQRGLDDPSTPGIYRFKIYSSYRSNLFPKLLGSYSWRSRWQIPGSNLFTRTILSVRGEKESCEIKPVRFVASPRRLPGFGIRNVCGKGWLSDFLGLRCRSKTHLSFYIRRAGFSFLQSLERSFRELELWFLPITYYWTGLLILDHSYLVGNFSNSKIAETKALEPLKSWHFCISNFRSC
jgi:hypothetical protein